MYKLQPTGQFRKDFKLCKKRGYNMDHLQVVLEILSQSGQLPPQYLPHKLHGDYSNYWECHIEPDWLLIYDVADTIRLISLIRTGSHNDLFR